VTRETANLISKLVSRPDETIIWLKFDSERVTQDSAATDTVLALYG